MAYKKVLVFTRDIAILAGIATIVVFVKNIETIAWGPIQTLGKECAEIIEKTGPDSADEAVPEACKLLITSLTDVIVSLLWCGGICVVFFWNVCTSYLCLVMDY